MVMVDQWQLQELCKVIEKADVWLFSEGVSSRMDSVPLFHLVDSVGAALQAATKRHGPEARIAVVSRGPYVLPRLRGAA